MASDRKYDMIIYGASGFTGQYVVKELALVQNTNKNRPIKWAVAGRNRSKLQQVVDEIAKITGINLQDIEIIKADSKDENSIREMCSMTKIVLNCVGPYRFYGEAVVRNAVEQGCDHVDISGEPKFLEEMELKYHNKAKDANTYVVGSCGADSIPADLGVTFTRDSFPGQLGVVDCYINLNSGPAGTAVNFATWESAVHGFSDANKLRKMRKEANSVKLPKTAKSVVRRGNYFKSEETHGYGIPFMGSDRSVVQRTLRYFYREENELPFQCMHSIAIASTLGLYKFLFYGFLFSILSGYKFGRYLLLTFPGLFSNGIFRRGGPSQKQIDGTTFSLTFYGYGFKDKNKSSEGATPDTRFVTKVSGPEPGYVTTPICMVQAAIAILEERDLLPSTGGVFTPGAAFRKTNIIKKLNDRGLKFSVIEQPSPFDKKIR
ncbi:Saccharopine dehydrogenase-like oxidoreductase [Trichoplax sp. H2]|nr:Saccharopine dehydrogenase-like oxidoreductase [Trichoplax sp. H2]|eukprot:RDD47010.1 Saccharopine dehydrogenase-like oxidoreductase [Trichoplax sp. H2]